MPVAVIEQKRQTLALARRGAADAFAGLIAPLLDPAYRLAAVMLGDRSAAEDAVQEASIKAWRKPGSLHGGTESLRSWFFAIVANECRMARRGRWWSVIKLADMPPSEMDVDVPRSDLHRAAARLDLDDRLPLVLHFYLDFPLDEVVRILGVSEAAAKSRIYRAAKRRGLLSRQS